jgi:hypothetical protein
MVPIEGLATERILSIDDGPHRSMALRHASIHGRPGLWSDDPDRPSSVVWLREGDDRAWEAFASGAPEPALGWLEGRSEGRQIALLAPPSWEIAVVARGGQIDRGVVRTWLRPDPPGPPSPSTTIEVHRLAPGDRSAFEATAPSWALRSWGDFATLISRGIAFGVPTARGFAALAWTYESDHQRDKIGVATLPRFRNLGLGRAAASTLVDHIAFERRKSPLWVTTPSNAASIVLARSLGFSAAFDETLLRWTPVPG